MGSSIGATVDEDACFLAMFIMISNALLSSPRRALRKTARSRTMLSSSTLKLGTVLPIYLTSEKINKSCLPGREGYILK